jgi:YidC/Oxa1 family membrane protein insertase
MLWLLGKFESLVGHIGVAIILLSLAVKVLMSPLTHIADRLQDSVNRTQALLQPQLDAIKRGYKGEEAHNLTLAVYKEHGVHPLYPLKSLVGFMIQIPIFIAAFDMLGENVALDEASFLWVADLAKPDRWVALPMVLPFFGGHLNLLPFLMTGVTVLTSWVQADPSLTPDLLQRQRQRLYLMAAAFFLLFYTFPAGMVLYWTTNNVLHLMKIKLLPAKSPSS